MKKVMELTKSKETLSASANVCEGCPKLERLHKQVVSTTSIEQHLSSDKIFSFPHGVLNVNTVLGRV